MENKYNIMITYRGDGDFKFVVRRIGEVLITKTKPVYIYNVTADVIGSLRELRRLLLDVTIGAKPDGAYKVYDFNDYIDQNRVLSRRVPESSALSNEDISSILKGATTPEVVETKPKEENKEEVKTTKKPSTTKKKSTKKKTSKK